MCITCVALSQKPVNWDGEYIVPDTAVPASRPIPGAKKKTTYDIDVREYVAWERNAVIRRVLDEKIVPDTPKKAAYFRSRAPGSFDFRARCVLAYVQDQIQYEPVRRNEDDPWRFPDETLKLRRGDCEDRAFVIAALLMASGVSPYNVRVALGRATAFPTRGKPVTHDHMWVMYKSEAGHWIPLEPAPRKKGLHGRPAIRYQPEFLFNVDHLWAVPGHGKPRNLASAARVRKAWQKLHPTFEGSVHQQIMEVAVGPLLVAADYQDALDAFDKAKIFSGSQGTVDSLDNPLVPYDPADHFDDAFIDAGWNKAQKRLLRFEGSQEFSDWVPAAHSIADFYAHSSYLHFCALRDGADAAEFWDPAWRNGDPSSQAKWDRPPKYDLQSFTPYGGGFSINTSHGNVQLSNAGWDGFVISGRYGQPDDPSRDTIEAATGAAIPDSRYGSGAGQQQLARITSLPHHDEIAVDETQAKSTHRLYGSTGDRRFTYPGQFLLRQRSAIFHVRKALLDHWKGKLTAFAQGPDVFRVA